MLEGPIAAIPSHMTWNPLSRPLIKSGPSTKRKTMSKKICLQWNDFKEIAIGSLESLKDDKDFLYVTLASEDGKQMEAHKLILALSSPFFKNLLKRNKHPHPLLYMRGLKSADLLAIVDFLYCGEAKVYED